MSVLLEKGADKKGAANPQYYQICADTFRQKRTELRTSEVRFQDISDRLGKKSEQRGDDATTTQLATGKFKTMWKGINTMTDCREMVVYQAIISEIKPLTIIELGSYTGGNAVWLADSLKVLDVPGTVLTVDIAADLVDPLAQKYPGLTCVTGDVNKIEDIFPGEKLKELPHPWLVIEDCHVNTAAVMRYFANHMAVGDYFAVEDTSRLMDLGGWGAFNDEIDCMGYWDDTENTLDTKHNTLIDFLKEYKEEFKVDAFYTDYFGFNATHTWDGYIKKVK